MNHYLTDIEQAKLLATIKQYADEKAQRDYHICSALIHSGMRIGEFLLITVGDTLAALDSGYIYIPADNRKGHQHKRQTVGVAQAPHGQARQQLRDHQNGKTMVPPSGTPQHQEQGSRPHPKHKDQP